MISIRIDTHDVRNMITELRRKQKIKPLLQEIEGKIHGELSYRTPVLTGNLKRSWRTFREGIESITAGFSMDYAPYQEYGTRYITGRFFLKKSVNNVKSMIPDLIFKFIRRSR